MAKKKLILYSIATFFTIIFLILVMGFVTRNLNTAIITSDEAKVNLVGGTKDSDDMLDVDDFSNIDDIDQVVNDISLEADDISPNSDEVDIGIDFLKDDTQPADNNDGISKEDTDVIETSINDAIIESIDDSEDPQHDASNGIIMDVREMDKSKDETDDVTYGIDVAKWQGVIDWAKVKEARVEFAMNSKGSDKLAQYTGY